MKGSALLCAVVALGLVGCTGEPSTRALSTPSATVPTAAPSPRPASPATATPPGAPTQDAVSAPRRATPTPTPSHDHGLVIELSDKVVAGVPMGTAAGEAERRLRAALGRPTHADDEPGCNGEKGRQLIWGEAELVVWIVAESGPDPVLSGWSARRSSRFDYRFPFDTRLGESAAATQRRVPDASGEVVQEGPYAESYVVRTPRRPGLLWIAKGPSAEERIYDVSYNPVGCD